VSGEPTYTIHYVATATKEPHRATLSRDSMRAHVERYRELIVNRVIRDVTVISRDEDVTVDWFG
jgi:hypothetical protein